MTPNETSPRLAAAIDVGTNTLRLLIGYPAENGRVVRLVSARSTTRLGRDLRLTSRLSSESVAKSIETLHSFKELCESHGTRRIAAVGTSALREAGNSRDFLIAVQEKTGITIRVISGEEEAELTLRGIRSSLPDEVSAGARTELILDVGGGSTEWIVCADEIRKGSLALGALKLHEEFLRHDPPHEDEIASMMESIIQHVESSSLVQNLRPRTVSWPDLPLLVATGGTATTVAAIDMQMERYDGDRLHMHRLPVGRVRKIFETLRALPLEKRRQVRGMEPERADIIVAGIAVVLALMERLAIDEVTVSDYGILEGLLLVCMSEE
ncbi:MAG: exopolyphosphatase [Chloroflexota bacterium]